MNEMKVTWKMAAEVLAKHFRLSLLFTLVFVLLSLAIANLAINYFGYEFDFYKIIEHRVFFTILLAIIYFIPINVYVFKKILNKEFSHFRIVAVLPRQGETSAS